MSNDVCFLLGGQQHVRQQLWGTPLCSMPAEQQRQREENQHLRQLLDMPMDAAWHRQQQEMGYVKLPRHIMDAEAIRAQQEKPLRSWELYDRWLETGEIGE